MHSFNAKIYKIGINTYVLLPAAVLKSLFKEAGKDKGPIPLTGVVNNHPFTQTLVKYAGKWRLYINGPMLKGSASDVGHVINISIEFDKKERITPMPPKLKAAFKLYPQAASVFQALPPSRQKEIKRYINSIKTEASVDKNVTRAIQFLLGKERFIGRDNP